MGGPNGGKRSASPRQIVFRDRLRAFIGNEPVGSVAHRLRIEYRRFHRWFQEGIERPTHRSLPAVKRLAKAMGLDDWHDLWEKGSAPTAERHSATRRQVDDLLKDERFEKLVVQAVEYIWQQREQFRSGKAPLESGIGGEATATGGLAGADVQKRPIDVLKRLIGFFRQ